VGETGPVPVAQLELNMPFRGKLRKAQTTPKPARVVTEVKRAAQTVPEGVDELRNAPEGHIQFKLRH
jgi:hypothetical protein